MDRHHRRGSAAIIAMMFLVIFGSLAGAMAIVAQGNLSTAEAHVRINRALSAADTGIRFLEYRLNEITAAVTTTDGLIDDSNAPNLWDQVRTALALGLSNEAHNITEPADDGLTLAIGPIAVEDGGATFTVTMTPHPINGEDYGSDFYQRAPYSEMETPVSSVAPLDSTWIRVRVQGRDGPDNRQITRTVQMDMKMDKKIEFAILSRSRVMIGRNVIIEGPIGSKFLDTQLENGHPLQVESNFRGLDAALDGDLDSLTGTLITNDVNGDNRINLANPTEVTGLDNPDLLDTNGDGYIDEYDFFLDHYDSNADGRISGNEMSTDTNVVTAELLDLIDTFGDPSRDGYGDGYIDDDDDYAKIHGEVKLAASMEGWNAGAADPDQSGDGAYQDYFQGPIDPGYGEDPLTFNTSGGSFPDLGPEDFDVSSFRDMAGGNLEDQATTQAANHDPTDPNSPGALGTYQFEAVPYGAAHPYDYYNRPVYENMVFTNVTIPAGENALFKNCTFIGVTFVATNVDNADANFNYVGMTESDGSQTYPGLTAVVGGTEVTDTKPYANNVRFDGCVFEGAVVSDAPPNFTQVRNKLSFTGTTDFRIDDSTNLTSNEKALFKRSTILAPHYSVELGTFIDPTSDSETVQLSGTIVAGVLDARGDIRIDGTILTTFEPVNNEGPVIGDTSPQFNTTLGYFPLASGDLEAELPASGLGVIQVRYDPDLALPDGIDGPIQINPVSATYAERGAY
jgi:hypothetical protein